MDADVLGRLLALAATQRGLFMTAQAIAAGLTEGSLRTLVVQKLCRRVYRGVYIFEGHEMSAAAVHLAAVFAGGPTARASHRAGAWLWDMTPYEQKPEITVLGVHTRIPDLRIHRTTTSLHEPALRLGVPTTTAAETLLDLGGVVKLHKVQAALDRAIANKILTPMSALAELDRRGKMGVRGTAALRRLLDQAGITGSHPPSVLEAKTRRLIQRAGLPQPECELTVGQHGEYRLDFVWPDLMLAVEVDGWMYHSSTSAFQRNKTRKNALVIGGYAILEYTWVHVTREQATVIRELQAAYRARSGLLVVQ